MSVLSDALFPTPPSYSPDVNLRCHVAALLALILVTATPARSNAEETVRTEETPAPLFSPVARDFTRMAGPLVLIGAPSGGLALTLFAKAPQDTRLSHGAKTAIIITAIVVGALLIVGVLAISRPGPL